MEAAQLRCLLYLFHAGKISPGAAPGQNLLLPTGMEQLRPLLAKAPVRHSSQGGGFDLSGDWTAVIQIWKGALTMDRNPDRAAVNAARLAYEAKQISSGGDPGRMQSQGRREALAKANAARNQSPASVPSAGHSEPVPSNDRMEELFDGSRKDYSPQPAPEPSIPAWQLERTDDSALDAGEECKKVSRAINEAHKAIGTLRGILYSQINTYGRDYLGFLRQVDAGAYSLHNIDEHVQQMGEDIDFIASLLTADVGEGELAASTVTVDAFPTKA